MKLYNSLTKTKQTFQPIDTKNIGVYTCGPTVYSYVTIGNWRTYVLGDTVVRSLKYLDYKVTYIMNITDVGHLTGDNLGDADTGEDRLEKAAQAEGKTAWDIAAYYAEDFQEGFEQLNLVTPKKFTKATDHIAEQIDLVEQIQKAGFTYTIEDGVYFDVKAYETAGHTYGKLSTIDQVKAGARVEPNPDKRDPRDFALWKFSYPHGRAFDSSKDNPSAQRHMEWPSPWGVGFPGWHIECSAMSMKYLGERFDIHVGGEDLRSTHHPNEIAQAEAATGKQPFVAYWLHGAFLQVDGGRMGKSLGNAYTLHDIKEHGFDPLALRYFYFTSHYRKPLNFTWEALETAQTTLKKLRSVVAQTKTIASKNIDISTHPSRQAFVKALRDDLNLPQALSIVWQVAKDAGLDSSVKLALLEDFDLVLGLELNRAAPVSGEEIPEDVQNLANQREQLRAQKQFTQADQIRDTLQDMGYEIEDSPDGSRVVKSRTDRTT